ncbi:MFS transporter [Desulfosarcina ovata]|uniref:MFS transporter n=2 Tax=Desulfosarcina ovata TaxID=83564 RepID=A0A5K8ACZ3_9BACT|nr:MFS transporter [Desulfosarcina ovata]BBO84094.1 MFS transporter [Desulfosarcina ovata subsp. sediminis]BBO90593.1 MFS transporter [Desulfosarcina ovata subsp. ovata]
MISNKTTIGVQYFLYFGAMGVFLPYFNLYCLKIGFSGFQIGTLSAVRSMVLIGFSLFWSILADRRGLRRPIYLFCSLASTALWSLFLLTTDFRCMLAITIVHGAFYAPLIAFLEAFAMDVLGRTKNHYGRTRAWGSIAFIAVVVVLGALIDRFAMRIILFLVLAFSLVQALAAFSIPRATARPPVSVSADTRLLSAPTLVFLVCAFLMLVSHGAYYGFFSIHLAELGHGGGFIGLCWALASGAEVVVMIHSGRLFARFSFKRVLVFSFFVAAVRWGILFTTRSTPVILASQLLHAITYGAFHMAGILYMDELAPPAEKTLGQALNNAVTYGLGLTVGFFVSGVLHSPGNSADLFLFSAGAALVGGTIFYAFHRWRPAVSSSPMDPTD